MAASELPNVGTFSWVTFVPAAQLCLCMSRRLCPRRDNLQPCLHHTGCSPYSGQPRHVPRDGMPNRPVMGRRRPEKLRTQVMDRPAPDNLTAQNLHIVCVFL